MHSEKLLNSKSELAVKQEVIIRKMFKTEIRNDDTDKVYNATFSNEWSWWDEGKGY